MCRTCHLALMRKRLRQPINSLANFQYYGYERLPDDIRDAFSGASIYDLMLISRARASQIVHFVVEEASQRYNQGNVAIRAQDSVELHTVLPPNDDDLRDAMCVVFTGQKQCPSRETIKQMRPVLVTKSRVWRLIKFLIAHNPWYQKSGVVYSQKNLDALFDDVDSDIDCGVPKSLEICHLPKASEDQHSVNDGGVQLRDIDTSNDVAPGDIVMEAVGFTQGDYSSPSREKMKLHALAHVLDRKCFLLSRTGADFVADNDPGLMSYLFPHLDPWDIGGFYHCGRTSKQQLSMEVQKRCQLRVYLLEYDSKKRSKQEHYISGARFSAGEFGKGVERHWSFTHRIG
ncbi:hypothetical protein DFH29DRAFT_1052643 [Suillus ampliporus]|nr:hypothetical protein DFH29DRAFT_1052643 [Suillus ampliporus]